MTDPVTDSITEALQDGNLTVEADGERVTRRSVKELRELAEIQREMRGEKPRPFAVLTATRYEP